MNLVSIVLDMPLDSVRLKHGWLVKDVGGLHWFSAKPDCSESGSWYGPIDCEFFENVGLLFEDPWLKSHPQGGPDCFLEVGCDEQ